LEVANPDWGSECVGTLALELPRGSEVASVSAARILAQLRGQPGKSKFRFADGELAGWSSLRYYGEIFITDRLNISEISSIRDQFSKSKIDYSKYVERAASQNGQAIRVVDVFPPRKDAIGWSVDDDARLFLEIDSHVLTMNVPKDLARSYSTSIKSRPIFSVAGDSELCIPYATVPLTASRERDIMVTYRLTSHPDVTVMIGDSNAVEYADPIRERNEESPMVIANFWAQYEMGKKIEQLLKPAFSKILIDRQEGLESFVKIKRDGAGEDYGYFATVRGKYGVRPEKATVQVYVLRNAEHARSVGKTPLEKAEFLRLARSIVGSIHAR
jgi:hypothetical protein